MKSFSIIAAVILVASAAALVGFARHGDEPKVAGTPSTQPGSPTTALAVVGVDQLMRNAKEYRGVVTVEGVVSAASTSDRKLALIDSKEFEACNTTDCAELVLPVRWTGPMPSVKEKVQVTGQVKPDDSGKLAFFASDMRVIAPSEDEK